VEGSAFLPIGCEPRLYCHVVRGTSISTCRRIFFLRKLLGTLAPDLGHRRFGEERPKVADPAALVNKDQKSDEGFA